MTISLVCVLFSLTVLPGYALLAVTRTWQDRRFWQLLCLSVGVSLSLYPTLFYFARWLNPGFALPAWTWWALLLASAAAIAWDWWRRRPAVPRITASGLAFLAILLLTFASRAWVALTHPYPAWTDSLHHTLATQLTMANGRLPTDLLPYANAPFSLYHLGLYAIAGAAGQATGAPAHSALLWTAQILNTYCVLGVFLVLDRYVGRGAALVGALTAGLLSHQPAFYVNWGRFTQLSAQTVFLLAWVATLDCLEGWNRLWRTQRGLLAAQVLWAGMMTAAVFMLHFRVAAFYILLLAPTVLLLAWRAWRRHTLGALTAATAAVGIVSLLLVSPILWSVLARYIGLHAALAQANPLSQAQMSNLEERYFVFGFDTFPYLVARPWLLALAGASLIFGLLRRQWLTWLMLAWVVLLMLLGNAYLLDIPVLEVTNLGAVLIMLYIPISLVVGVAAGELQRWLSPKLPPAQAPRLRRWALVAIVLACLPFVWVRSHDIEPYRFFVTDADVKAMQWIERNLPPDARFAINTSFWLPNAPLGTDAGYWIPYFTQRQTNTGVMLSNMGDPEQAGQMLAVSKLAERLASDPGALDRLHDLGYDYVYIGEKGNSNGGGLNAAALVASGLAEQIYNDGNISILRSHAAAAQPPP